MSIDDELTAVQRCLDDLAQALARLESGLGRSPADVRRVREDAGRLRESLGLLREGARKAPEETLVQIPDTPYDSSLWRGADEEGLGGPDRHAP
ncbi:hypothetical protein ACFP1Z_01600 [Streptomyces gamaensis]|uniref:Uncharacterized protein n=1 Tax=Streptomyces gamaensis TaxID=1763542 RepID=A0ABW0YQP6_9ACTN